MADEERPRVSFTLTEAGERCGVHRSTMRRHLDAGEFPNAWREDGPKGPESGPWRVPIGDLLALGYTPGRPTEGDPQQETREKPASAPATSAGGGSKAAELEARVRELEALVTLERERREAAERVAEERLARVDDLRMAMRMLESGQDERKPWFRRGT